MDNETQSYCFLMPVWGRRFVDIFLNYALPSHLAPGNLPELKQYKNHYIIYTFAADIEYIKKHALYAQLESFCCVRFEVVQEDIKDHRLLAADCYQHGIEFALQHNCRVFLTIPDGVFSINSFKFVDAILSQGYKGIMAPCHSVEIKATDELLQKHRDAKGILQLSGRECVDIVLQAMHSNTKNKFYLGSGNLMPASLCWQVGNQGILSHSFHLPPIAAILRPDSGKFAGAIDLDFMITHCPDSEDIYYVQDSDNLALFEVVDEKHLIEAIHHKENPDHIVDWAIVHANEQHRASFEVPLVQKSSAYIENDEQWLQTHAAVQSLVGLVGREISSKFSISKFLKYKYSYLRKLILDLHNAARLNKHTKINVLIRFILHMHRGYVIYAALFLNWQDNLLQKLYKVPAGRCYPWNLNYWPCKLLGPYMPRSIIFNIHCELYFQKLLSKWFNIEFTSEYKQDCEISSKIINLNAANYISKKLPELLDLNRVGHAPLLVQAFKLPLRFMLILSKIMVFNFVLACKLKKCSKENLLLKLYAV